MSGRTVGTQTTNITQDKINAKVVDLILDGDIVTSLFMSKGRPWRGEKYKKNFKYTKSTSSGFYTGMGSFDVTQQDITKQLEWTAASMYQSVTLPYFELSVNKTEAVINQEALALESAKADMLDSIGNAFYGDGTSNAFDGLDIIVDDGTVASTYGGQSRTTYAGLNADVTSSVGSIALNDIAASIDAATHGSDEPNLIITTPTIWRAIEDLLFPSITAQYGAAGSTRGKINRMGDMSGQSLTGLAGYTAIYYRGIPIVKDQKCSAGDIYYINTNYTYWSGLSHAKHGTISLGSNIIEGVGNIAPTNHGICFTGFKEPINQDGETGQFLLYGNMICEAPDRNAKDEGVTA